MPKGTKTLGNNKARAWESLGFEHKKEDVPVLTHPPSLLPFYSADATTKLARALLTHKSKHYFYTQSNLL